MFDDIADAPTRSPALVWTAAVAVLVLLPVALVAIGLFDHVVGFTTLGLALALSLPAWMGGPLLARPGRRGRLVLEPLPDGVAIRGPRRWRVVAPVLQCLAAAIIVVDLVARLAGWLPLAGLGWVLLLGVFIVLGTVQVVRSVSRPVGLELRDAGLTSILMSGTRHQLAWDELQGVDVVDQDRLQLIGRGRHVTVDAVALLSDPDQIAALVAACRARPALRRALSRGEIGHLLPEGVHPQWAPGSQTAE